MRIIRCNWVYFWASAASVLPSLDRCFLSLVLAEREMSSYIFIYVFSILYSVAYLYVDYIFYFVYRTFHNLYIIILPKLFTTFVICCYNILRIYRQQFINHSMSFPESKLLRYSVYLHKNDYIVSNIRLFLSYYVYLMCAVQCTGNQKLLQLHWTCIENTNYF